MTKLARRKNWNPSVVAGHPFVLPVEWEGQDGPATIPFEPSGPIDFSHDGRSAKGYAWVSPSFGLKVIATADNRHHGRLLHVSVSHTRVLPPWPVMIAIKRHFFPDDVAAAMVMPEEAVYVNQHSRCLHISQLPVEWGIG